MPSAMCRIPTAEAKKRFPCALLFVILPRNLKGPMPCHQRSTELGEEIFTYNERMFVYFYLGLCAP